MEPLDDINNSNHAHHYPNKMEAVNVTLVGRSVPAPVFSWNDDTLQWPAEVSPSEQCLNCNELRKQLAAQQNVQCTRCSDSENIIAQITKQLQSANDENQKLRGGLAMLTANNESHIKELEQLRLEVAHLRSIRDQNDRRYKELNIAYGQLAHEFKGNQTAIVPQTQTAIVPQTQTAIMTTVPSYGGGFQPGIVTTVPSVPAQEHHYHGSVTINNITQIVSGQSSALKQRFINGKLLEKVNGLNDPEKRIRFLIKLGCDKSVAMPVIYDDKLFESFLNTIGYTTQ
jgi:hypothetical protein